MTPRLRRKLDLLDEQIEQIVLDAMDAAQEQEREIINEMIAAKMRDLRGETHAGRLDYENGLFAASLIIDIRRDEVKSSANQK